MLGVIGGRPGGGRSLANRFHEAARRGLLATMIVALAGCTPDLPEPESKAAALYTSRCGGCHRLYPPNVMTAATWHVILKRMQGEMRRRGFPPLTADETAELQAYLGRHALATQQGTTR